MKNEALWFVAPYSQQGSTDVSDEIIREREREGGGGGSERHYISGGDGNIIFCLKVPRQCPLVLLIGVRFYFKVIESDMCSKLRHQRSNCPSREQLCL
jgi:hypothetical protein